MLRAWALAWGLVAILLAPALASTVDESELDIQTREVSKTLRCTVCQTENVWELGSPFAKQLRDNVRERLQKGDTPDQIREYFLSRYGDYILMQPPTRGVNWLVWLGPFALLAIGGALLYRTLSGWVTRTPAPGPIAPPLDEASRQRIDRELKL